MIEKILEERRKTHGNFEDVAEKAQYLKVAWKGDFIQISRMQREALDMIASKICRILCGNADEADHWNDIAGYATLVSQHLEKKKEEAKKRIVHTEHMVLHEIKGSVDVYRGGD